MIRMKPLLAENMKRFGTKNLPSLTESSLSDDDILDIILSYTKDPDAAEAALANYRETGNFGDDAIESNVTSDPRWNLASGQSDLRNFERKIKKARPKFQLHYHKHAVFASEPGDQESYTIFINDAGEPTRIVGTNPVGRYEYETLDDLYNDLTSTGSSIGDNKYRTSNPNPKNWSL